MVFLTVKMRNYAAWLQIWKLHDFRTCCANVCSTKNRPLFHVWLGNQYISRGNIWDSTFREGSRGQRLHINVLKGQKCVLEKWVACCQLVLGHCVWRRLYPSLLSPPLEAFLRPSLDTVYDIIFGICKMCLCSGCTENWVLYLLLYLTYLVFHIMDLPKPVYHHVGFIWPRTCFFQTMSRLLDWFIPVCTVGCFNISIGLITACSSLTNVQVVHWSAM